MLSIDKFLEYLRSELNRSQRTVENYREDLKLFEQYARNLSESFTWESVDSDMIRNWMEHMIDAGNKATSVKSPVECFENVLSVCFSQTLCGVGSRS